MHAVEVPLAVAIAQAKWNALTNAQRGAHILAAIDEHGATKTELANRLGVSWNTVQSWITGSKGADWSRWMSIALALGVSETWEPTPGVVPKKKRRERRAH